MKNRRNGLPTRSWDRLPCRPVLDSLEPRLLLSHLVVWTLEDSGQGSLRDAITQANAVPGPDVIDFAVPVGATVLLKTALPALNDATGGTTINGYIDAADGPDVILRPAAGFEVAEGLRMYSSANTVRGLVIQGFDTGIVIYGRYPFAPAVGNGVYGCHIGTSIDGLSLPEATAQSIGVLVRGSAPQTEIGRAVAGKRNVISGNGYVEVRIAETADTIVEGNLIGLGADGRTDLGVSRHSIRTTGSTGTVIRENTISAAKSGAGLSIHGSSGTRISGNVIGATADGLTERGHWGEAVLVTEGSDLVVGGPLQTDRNLLVGSTDWSGIVLEDVSGGLLEGNYMGLGADGATPMGNHLHGMELRDGNTGITIRNNVIGANRLAGISVADGNVDVRLEGNLIGATADLSAPRGNGWEGVVARGQCPGLVIGGVQVGQGNTIRHCGGAGIRLEGPTGVLVAGNSIAGNGGAGIALVGSDTSAAITRTASSGNAGPGIDLGNDGPTPNDVGDADTGPNGLLNYPVLESGVAVSPDIVQVSGLAGAGHTVEVYRADPEDDLGGALEYLGSSSADPSGGFSIEIPRFEGWLTATATDAAGNTSEYAVRVPSQNQPPTIRPIGDRLVSQGGLLCFLVRAGDSDTPAQTVSFSLADGSPAGIAIDSETGLLVWRVGHEVAEGQYAVVIRATDNGTPNRSYNEEFIVTVVPTAQQPDEGVFLVPSAFLGHEGGAGLMGSYIDQDLGGDPSIDWREVQTIAGVRVDEAVDFTTTSWGSRQQVGVSGGSDDGSWTGYSVQWDGWIDIPTPGTSLHLRSSGSARLYVDLNGDGTFDPEGGEMVSAGVGPGSSGPPLEAGRYAVRIQYSRGWWGANEVLLGWDDRANSAGLLESSGSIGSASEADTVSLLIDAGATLRIAPVAGRNNPDERAYAPGVKVFLPNGDLHLEHLDGSETSIVAPVAGSYTIELSGEFITGQFRGAYNVSFRT